MDQNQSKKQEKENANRKSLSKLRYKLVFFNWWLLAVRLLF